MEIWDHLKSWLHRKEAEKFVETEDGKTAVRTTAVIISPDGDEVSVQHPIPTDGDSIYVKDLDLSVSDNYNFSGSVTDYFDSLTTINNDVTANSPKQIKLWFKRTIYSDAVAFGCNDLAQNFSNIKVELLGSGEVVRKTIDESADNTKYNSKVIQFDPTALNGIIISFVTTDAVCLSNINVRKNIPVEARIQALTDDGVLVNIEATDSGNLKVANVEDGLAIAKGDVEGSTFIHKFGNAPDFDAVDGVVTVWDGADAGHIDQMTYVYSTSDDIDSVSSDSVADTFDIQVYGLDINWEDVTQTVTLTGQTRVALTTPLLRIYRMENTNGVDNTGHIYCYENTAIVGGIPTDSTLVRAVMQPGNNQTLMGTYTIPAGKTGYVRDWYASTAGANKTSNYTVELRIRPVNGVFQLKHVAALSDNASSYIQHDYSEPEVVMEMSDIEMRTRATANGVTAASVSAGFDIVLIDNE